MRFFWLLSMIFSFSLCAELKHVSIGNFDFLLITDTYDEYDSKGEVMKLYAEENNNDLTFMLSLILQDRTGTCADKSLEDGTYEINGTTLTLYSAWNRIGRAYGSPYGARIQVYELQPNVTFKRTSSRLYIETQRKNYDKDSNIKYLFKAPTNESEKQAFESYIDDVEKNFKGTFVLGDEAIQLISEVQEALKRKMKTKWK